MSASRIAYPLIPIIHTNFPRVQLKNKKRNSSHHSRKRVVHKDSRTSFAASPSSPPSPLCHLSVSEIPFLLYLLRKDTTNPKEQSATTKLVVLYATRVEPKDAVECGFTANQNIWKVSGSKIPLTFNEDHTQHVSLQLAYVAESGVKLLDKLKLQVDVEDLMRPKSYQSEMSSSQEKMSLVLSRMGKSSFEVHSLDIYFDAQILE